MLVCIALLSPSNIFDVGQCGGSRHYCCSLHPLVVMREGGQVNLLLEFIVWVWFD